MSGIEDMKIGESAIFKDAMHSSLKLKLREMGLMPGDAFTYVRKAPLGDPYIIKISDTQICIRKKDAKLLVIEKKSEIE